MTILARREARNHEPDLARRQAAERALEFVRQTKQHDRLTCRWHGNAGDDSGYCFGIRDVDRCAAPGRPPRAGESGRSLVPAAGLQEQRRVADRDRR
jgi:hypothetical protein